MDNLKSECEAMAKTLGVPGGGGFLQCVILRARTLAEKHPERTGEEILQKAFEQTIERERYLMSSDQEDAKIFRRVLVNSVYHQARAKAGMNDELDRIEQERGADALRDASRAIDEHFKMW
jgi:hypothetical protein